MHGGGRRVGAVGGLPDELEGVAVAGGFYEAHRGFFAVGADVGVDVIQGSRHAFRAIGSIDGKLVAKADAYSVVA